MGFFTRKKKDTPETPTTKDVVVEQKKSKSKNIDAHVPVNKIDKKSEVYNKKFVAQKAKQIIIRPLITEKATMLGANNKYLFEVRPDTNKVEVKKEIKRLYEVQPIEVHMINHAGKNVSYGRSKGRTKHRKKAIVTLKEGDHIESKAGA